MGFNRNQTIRGKIARTFEEHDVARCYSYRPPYPDVLFDYLFRIVNPKSRALDLGSGPGKIATVLAGSFDEVIALDPSGAMIEYGRNIDGGKHQNLKWIRMRAEDYEDPGIFSVVTAGSSIHWCDHKMVFPKLAKWTKTVAIISGDGPDQPPCGRDLWNEFISKWLSVLAKKDPSRWSEYNPSGFAAESNRHENWIDIAGKKQVSHTFFQSLSDFVESQHSQATWSRKAMSKDLSD